MNAVSIADLQTPDSPAVIRALGVACSICKVPPKEFCHAIGLGKKMASLVHIARATAHYPEAKGER